MMPRHFEETPVLVFKQNNIVDALSVHYLDTFNSDNFFRDFNMNKMQFIGQKYIISSPCPALRKQKSYNNYTKVFLCHA